jgi:tRNA modification GTPase
LDSSALVVFFPGPNSATGEDLLELHVHGGSAVVKAVLAAIPKATAPTGLARYAEPGEFTRRAFLNERMDLPQIEALGDVLAADTEQQRRLSTRGAAGNLARRYESWRQQLLYARGELEALIDFSEDQHFDESPFELVSSVSEQIDLLKSQIEVHRTNAVRGELLRNGISVSLLGAPNAGKSSLLNRIVGREAAIVSREEGTTRDVVEVGVDIGGWLCRFGDMAGLRVGKSGGKNHTGGTSIIGEVEKEGIKRAKARALESDLVVVVLSIETSPEGVNIMMEPEVVSTARQVAIAGGNLVVVVNKIDRLPSYLLIPAHYGQEIMDAIPGVKPEQIYPISCKIASLPASNSPKAVDADPDPGNIQAFLAGLLKAFGDMTAALTPGENAITSLMDVDAVDNTLYQESLGASVRQRQLLEECLACLDTFLAETVAPPLDAEGKEEVDIVVAAEALRAAADCLSRITGRGEAGDVEEVLGVVFEKFCVGK